MNIYLPMKNNLLDKGEGTIWTGGGLKEPEIVRFNGVKCAKFDGNSRLRLNDTTLIKSLKKWTIQVWIYPTKVGDYESQSFIFTNYMLGGLPNSSYLILDLRSNTSILFGHEKTITIAPIFNAWHHIKLINDGTKMSLFIDKIDVGSISSTDTALTRPFTIGDESGSYGYGTKFYGYMTQFKFSDKYNDKDLPLNDSKFVYINQNNEAWAMV